MSSRGAPRCLATNQFSWSDIFVHSLEVPKGSQAAPSNLFRKTNNAKLFVEVLCSNTLFKSDTTDPAYHTTVNRTPGQFDCCRLRFATIQEDFSNTGAEYFKTDSLVKYHTWYLLAIVV